MSTWGIDVQPLENLGGGGDPPTPYCGAFAARVSTLQVELDCLGVFGLAGFRYILDGETEHERGPVAMADDYQLKYVARVAGVIGAVVLFLGLVGLIANIS